MKSTGRNAMVRVGQTEYASIEALEVGDIHVWSDGDSGLVIEEVVERGAMVNSQHMDVYKCRPATTEEIIEATRPMTDDEIESEKEIWNDFFAAVD